MNIQQSTQAIAIFDSGLGGLSVWKEVAKLLPQEAIFYYADSAYCPYGSRKPEEIQARCRMITDFFLRQGVKIIVVACNTATAAAIRLLRETYSLPFVGMEPAIKPAALSTQTGCIGVMATQGTLKGGHFRRTSERYAQGVKVIIEIGHGLVELVEKGIIRGPEAEHLLRKYLHPMLDAGADRIILGCTHYPFLLEPIEKIVAGTAQIMDPAPAVAQQVKRVLEAQGLLSSSEKKAPYRFYTSGPENLMENFLNSLFLKDASVGEIRVQRIQLASASASESSSGTAYS